MHLRMIMIHTMASDHLDSARYSEFRITRGNFVSHKGGVGNQTPESHSGNHAVGHPAWGEGGVEKGRFGGRLQESKCSSVSEY